MSRIVAQGPAIVLLDEPSAGLAHKETEALEPLLRAVQRHLACSLLVIEHHMPLVAALADRVVAMEGGRIIAEGPPNAVLPETDVAVDAGGPRLRSPDDRSTPSVTKRGRAGGRSRIGRSEAR